MACLVIFGGLFFGALTSVSAQRLVTFAQFIEKNGSQDFVFTNNSTSALFNTVGGGSAIDFRFQNITGLSAELGVFQDAHLFLSAATNSPATSNGNNFTQTINTANDTIRIIRDTPATTGGGSRTNLLTVTFSPIGTVVPSITGTDGGNSASFSATTPDHVVTFTSDFLNFANSTQRNFALSFSSVLPALSVGTGGFLNSFAAAGSGTFASNPPPTIFAPPTAAAVTVSGHALTPAGRGLRNALVTVTESNGSTRTILTGVYGAYSFADLAAGQTIVLSVQSKSYQFSPYVVTPSSDLSGVELVPDAK